MTADKTSEWLQNRREEIQTADYSDQCANSIINFLDAYNADSFRLKPPIKEGKDSRENTLSAGSRLAYASTLHRTAQWVDLTTCTATDLNRIAEQRLNGTHESVDSDGVSQNTVHQNQIAWRSYAQFHVNHPDGTDIEIEPDEIILVDRDDTTVDERDMFDPDEIEALRQAAPNKRDRAILEMLIYTGQRHNALRMLKYKDVQPDEGESGMLYLPDIEEGLKGSEGKRPLLGAQKHAREWKRAHPTQEPDHAFFTHIYDWSGHDSIEPGDHLSKQVFGDIPQRIAEKAGVEKQTNPHQFRHYFTTMAISKHGMSFDTVRHLLGHAAGSRELEETYQHLVDDDYIETAELNMGIRDEREESLTPSRCFTCNEPLEPTHQFCPNCGQQYGPNATDVKEDIESRKAEGALAANDPQIQDNVRKLIEALDDPERLNQLLNALESTDTDLDHDPLSD